MKYELGMGIYVNTLRRIPETSLFYRVTAHYDCDDEGMRLAKADELFAEKHANETIVNPPSPSPILDGSFLSKTEDECRLCR